MLPSTTLLSSLHLLSSRCASVSPSFLPSRDNSRSKPEPHYSSCCCCSFWSAICLHTLWSIVHTLTSNPLMLPHIRILLQHRLGILCLSSFSLSGTPLRMGIGEITSWRSCLKPPIAEILGSSCNNYLFKMFLMDFVQICFDEQETSYSIIMQISCHRPVVCRPN